MSYEESKLGDRDLSVIGFGVAVAIMVTTIFVPVTWSTPPWAFSLFATALVSALGGIMIWGTVPGQPGRGLRVAVVLTVATLAAVVLAIIWIDHVIPSSRWWPGLPAATSLFLFGIWSISAVLLLLWLGLFSSAVMREQDDETLRSVSAPFDEADTHK